MKRGACIKHLFLLYLRIHSVIAYISRGGSVMGLFDSLFKRKLTPEQTYEKGVECYNAKDYENALAYFQSAAQEGYVQAQLRVSQMY